MTDKPNNDQPSSVTLASRRSFLKHSIIAASGVALFGGMSLSMRSAAWAAGGDVETPKAKLGFIALTDAAPLFVAAEKGFFAKYGMTEVEVLKQSSWAPPATTWCSARRRTASTARTFSRRCRT